MGSVGYNITLFITNDNTKKGWYRGIFITIYNRRYNILLYLLFFCFLFTFCKINFTLGIDTVFNFLLS